MFGAISGRVRKLERENQVMREALLWYAARETWRRRGVNPKGAPRRQWKKSPAAFDRGSLAVRVLTEYPTPPAAGFIGRLVGMFGRPPDPKPAHRVTVPKPLAECEPTTTE